jgi:hypothetical protein
MKNALRLLALLVAGPISMVAAIQRHGRKRNDNPNLLAFAVYLPPVANEQIRMKAQDPDGMPLLEPI